jgi:hypothetical protein
MVCSTSPAADTVAHRFVREIENGIPGWLSHCIVCAASHTSVKLACGWVVGSGVVTCMRVVLCHSKDVGTSKIRHQRRC